MFTREKDFEMTFIAMLEPKPTLSKIKMLKQRAYSTKLNSRNIECNKTLKFVAMATKILSLDLLPNFHWSDLKHGFSYTNSQTISFVQKSLL